MKKQRSKNNRLICSVVLLALTVSSCLGIMAYATYKDQIINAITVGFNEIEIKENYKPPAKLEPGVDIKKEVSIINTGPVPCYVRVLAEYTNSKMKDCSDADFDSGLWVKIGEYYYYTELLEPGEESSKLLKSVSIDSTIKESDLEAFDILIYAESKQGTEVEEYWKVWGVTPAI